METTIAIATTIIISFILSAIWKWGESKWITIMRILQYFKSKIDKPTEEMMHKYNEASMARNGRHKMSVFFVVPMLAAITYGYMGLSTQSILVFFIVWVMFWIEDIFLNIFNKEKLFYRGKTATMDKVGFEYRALILLTLIVGLILSIKL